MMEEIDEQDLSTAIALGTEVCNELKICCAERGRIIYQIYQKLNGLKEQRPVAKDTTVAGAIPEEREVI